MAGDLTAGLFFPTLNGAGGLTASSEDSEGTGLLVLDDGVATWFVLRVTGSSRVFLLAGM